MSGDDIDDGTPINYERLKAFSKTSGRNLESLHALGRNNDPFMAELPGRDTMTQWFVARWNAFGCGPQTHTRKVHYLLLSQKEQVFLPNGEPYENTERCWNELSRGCRDARYLGLIPPDHVIDRRNSEAVINHHHLSESQHSAATRPAGGF